VDSKKEAAKNRLRAAWHFGDDWRLTFGRELIATRDDIPHGEWIKFLESEFGLHRQTAYNWMRKAAEADGVSLDEPQTNGDEPDTHADDVAGLIADEQNKVEKALDVQLNGPKPIRLVLDAATEDEKELYKAELKSNREWVQGILRDAFNTILAGKPVVTGQKLNMTTMNDEQPINDDDLPETFFVQQETEYVA
jgi:hypothetical protein